MVSNTRVHTNSLRMERIFTDFPSELEDQYTPSGAWYPPHHDEPNDTCSFFQDSQDCTDNSDQWYNHPQREQSLHPLPPNNTNNHKSNPDPFSVRCRIPVPESGGYHLWLETSFMCRRNERERQRVRSVNEGFSRLRNHLPRGSHVRRRQSKVDTLRHAITYIKQLQTMLDDKKDVENACGTLGLK